ncbi:MAG: LDCC motif putative metal-binding protein [Bacteroidales bacterium]|jgi:copper chaperone CopZ|nr:LDCC motif putative metal-binding protein [Bacteroidales bacterium]
MNAITSSIVFHPERTLSQDEVKKIRIKLTEMKGVTSISVETGLASIEYYRQVLSDEMIHDALTEAGFPFKQENDKPGIFKKLIEKLGHDNKEAFGGHPLSCCGK